MTPISGFRPGCLGEMTTPAFILPVDDYGEALAIFGNAKNRVAMFVGDQRRFDIMPADRNDRWRGILIENLNIEADLASAFSTESQPRTRGTLLRTATELKIFGNVKDGGLPRAQSVVIATDLSSGPDRYEVGFRRWSLVKRDGDRILFERVIEAEPLQKRK